MNRFFRRLFRKRGKEVSMEYVRKVIEDFLVSDFQNQVIYNNIQGITLSDSGVVEIVKKCTGHECPLHESRADCCYGSYEVDGERFCKEKIDLTAEINDKAKIC